MRFAKWVFWAAGVYGIIIVVPLYFLESKLGRDMPPAINHPEYYYGFAGACLIWQILFLVVASDPVRLRPVMIPAVLEKMIYAVAMPVLFLLHRVPGLVIGTAMADAAWAVLFAAAYVLTRNSAAAFRSAPSGAGTPDRAGRRLDAE